MSTLSGALSRSDGPTSDHTLQRALYIYIYRSALPVAMHFVDCDLEVKEEDVVILFSTNKM